MRVDKDYYSILQINQTATKEEIKQAYRNLARRFHPDTSSDPQAADRFRDIQEAYELLSDPKQREGYDAARQAQGLSQASAVSLRTIISHNSVRQMPEEQAFYALLEITSATDLATARLPLNLCLVLDKSTSMQGMRLQQVKEATRQIIDRLTPDDVLSLVVFSDRAEVLIPGQNNIDKAMAKSIASTIQPSGGTEMLQGLLAGLKQIEENRTESSVNHIILLTDGQTYGDEDGCREQAEWAGLHQISLTTMGIGSDWNEDLLDQMAASSGGNSVYIDSPRKVVDVFKSIIRELGSVIARELIMTLNPANNVRLEEAFLLTPHIRRLDFRGEQAVLGPLGTNQGKTLLLEFRLSNLQTVGGKRLARITVEGDVPGQSNRRSWEWSEISVEVSNAPDLPVEVPPTIVTALGKLAIFKMQEKAVADLERGEISAATQRFETMATRLLNLGETDLARAALLEAGRLSRTGNLSPEGRKKIRYGTRALSILPKEIRHD
ncbi:MAG: DnaJ domain-containing protein [Anaerolineae bacterium]